MESFKSEFRGLLEISKEIAGNQPKYLRPINAYIKVFNADKIPTQVHYDYCQEIFNRVKTFINDYRCKNHELLIKEELVIIFNKEKGTGKARVEITDLYTRAQERYTVFDRDPDLPLRYLQQVLNVFTFFTTETTLTDRIQEIKTQLAEIEDKKTRGTDVNSIVDKMINSLGNDPNSKNLIPVLNMAKGFANNPMTQALINRIVPVIQETGTNIGPRATQAISATLPTAMEEYEKIQSGKTNLLAALSTLCRRPELREVIDSLTPLAKETVSIAKDFGIEGIDMSELENKPLSEILLSMDTTNVDTDEIKDFGAQFLKSNNMSNLSAKLAELTSTRKASELTVDDLMTFDRGEPKEEVKETEAPSKV